MGKSGIKMWKRKILVIESSAADYAEIEEILGETYELRRAEPETREVFTRIREQKPDLILLDTRLPGEGFFQITEAITGNADTAEIPVVFIDAEGKRGSLERGFKLGCADYVRKPFEPDIMRSKISTQIELYG